MENEFKTANRKLKVCVFCETWKSGGIESFLCNLIHEVDKERFEIDLVVAELSESVFTEPLQNEGVGIYKLSGDKRRLLQNYRLFRKLIRRRRYDVVHVNAFQGMTLYYLHIARAEGVPIRIAHSHNDALRRSMLRDVKLLIHKVFSRMYTADGTELLACSQSAAAFMFSNRELLKRGYHFIPNGIDTHKFCFSAESRKSTREKLGVGKKHVIGNVGRLCYQKNQEFVIDVFSEYLKMRPDSILLLVGEGEDYKILKGKVNGLGISKDVIFYGTSSNVDQLLCAMDVFLFPSRFEGFGIVAIEAQATGLYTICSDRVPKEVGITPLIKYLSLSLGAKAWANAILEVGSKVRHNMSSSIRNAGFDRLNAVRIVEAIYEGKAYARTKSVGNSSCV